jgi:hypothetical protein
MEEKELKKAQEIWRELTEVSSTLSEECTIPELEEEAIKMQNILREMLN